MPTSENSQLNSWYSEAIIAKVKREIIGWFVLNSGGNSVAEIELYNVIDNFTSYQIDLAVFDLASEGHLDSKFVLTHPNGDSIGHHEFSSFEDIPEHVEDLWGTMLPTDELKPVPHLSLIQNQA